MRNLLSVIPSIPRYIQMGDRIALQCLVRKILDRKHCITVNDGEEDTLEYDTNFTTIIDALATTDWDYIKVFDIHQNYVGMFWVIYNNGNEFEPIGLISDYTDNEFCNTVYKAVEATLGVA